MKSTLNNLLTFFRCILELGVLQHNENGAYSCMQGKIAMVLNNGKSTSEIAYEQAKRKIEALEQLISRQRKVDEDDRRVPCNTTHQEEVDRHANGKMVHL